MSRRRRSLFGAVLAACIAITPAMTPTANAGDSGRYVGGGTAVARSNGQPVADEGSVVCDAGDGVGAGGVCLAFGGGNAVEVADDVAGQDVPFQVCIDNSGDGVCTSPDFGACADQVFFSHDDAGAFFNPVGPLPTGFAPGCAGGPWKGYVVLLCEGVHATAADAHSHAASAGTATVTTGGEGLGTFCGGVPANQSRKPYTVGSGARYMSGGTAVARQDGQPVVDEGSVLCNNGDNVGVGGFCTSFGGGDAMAVFDAASGTDVPFQVCVDNNGDGLCTSPDPGWWCPDQVFFSHDDSGAFFNPVGPLPTGFAPGCPGGPWNGYVVFLCEGTHVDGLAPHAHAATTGTGRVTTGGEGLGTFCGGSYASPSSKRYALDPQAPDVEPVLVVNGDGECTLRATRQSGATGQGFEGAATVRVVGPAPTSVLNDVRCSIVVNGMAVGQVSAPDGRGATSGSGRVAFDAGPADVVTLCTSGRIDGTPFERCTDTTRTQAPPQELADLVAAVTEAAGQAGRTVTDAVDGLGCPLLASLAPGVQGIADIGPDGDLTVRGELLIDCPPHG